jgi:hypothetical protein
MLSTYIISPSACVFILKKLNPLYGTMSSHHLYVNEHCSVVVVFSKILYHVSWHSATFCSVLLVKACVVHVCIHSCVP